jgi:hypothetical protein
MYNEIFIFFYILAFIFHLALLVPNIQLPDSMRWSERLLPCADFRRYIENDHGLCVYRCGSSMFYIADVA